eukprot:m.43455 g.43455  ORF g.43455 m.43455 type:complete len:875 (+) comp6409_c0_seq1:110-2734(+)
MITPVFTVEQDALFVRVLITAPHLNLAAVDFAVDGHEFKFVSHPYFLRLQLPGEVVEDGRETCTYDSDTGVVTASVPKKVPGEVFEGLDLLTTLLARRPSHRAAGPLIEVISDTPAAVPPADGGGGEPGGEADADHDRAADADGEPLDDFTWELEQTLPDVHDLSDGGSGSHAHITAPAYGFALRYSGTLGPICREVPGVVELMEPDSTPIEARRAIREAAEDEQFDAEHYACDHADSTVLGTHVNEALNFEPLWRTWERPHHITVTDTITTGHGAAAVVDDDNGGGAIETTKGDNSASAQGSLDTSHTTNPAQASTPPTSRPRIVFSDSEMQDMRQLPRREYLVDAIKPELISLVDIVYAWAYDHRVTQGDHTVESAWTIATVSSTLSFLARHQTVYEAVVASIRRAVAYPLCRSFRLAVLVLEDTRTLFRMGVRAILKCLLDARAVLSHDEVKHYLADIYLTDYCVWLQTVSERTLRALSSKLDTVHVSKDDVAWPLARIEAVVDEEGSESEDDQGDGDSDSDDEDGDSSSDSDSESEDGGGDADSGTDSDDVSSGESESEPDPKPVTADVAIVPAAGQDKEAVRDNSDPNPNPCASTSDVLNDHATPMSVSLEADPGCNNVDVDSNSKKEDAADENATATHAVVPWRFANPWIDTRKMPRRELTFVDTLVVVRQEVNVDIDVHHNTGLILWDAAFVLARFMETRLGRAYFAEKRVLELGSGTGLPSIVAALLGGRVVATDLDEALPLLRENVACAVEQHTEGDLSLVAEHLVWSADTTHADAPFDVVLCSEVIYDRACHDDLLACLKALSSPTTEVLFAYKRRGLGEDDFVARLHASPQHRVVVVPQAALESDFREAGIGLLRVHHVQGDT